MLLPYFKNIFGILSVACLANRQQMRVSLNVNFSRNFVVRISIRALTGKKFNCFWQSVTTLAHPVRNNFINERVIVNSNDCLSLTNTGHASTPRKSTDKHLTEYFFVFSLCFLCFGVCRPLQLESCWTKAKQADDRAETLSKFR